MITARAVPTPGNTPNRTGEPTQADRPRLKIKLEGNRGNAFHPELTQVRADSVAKGNALPVLPNPGVGVR